ncbi:hypothetical protein NJ7G_0205 [Natrinema sp. J7-2]|nr:hypothetical protein NJ7G_0205 [Natrinema sp. J7-2]
MAETDRIRLDGNPYELPVDGQPWLSFPVRIGSCELVSRFHSK